jgi:CheY-like chemotaxis protein
MTSAKHILFVEDDSDLRPALTVLLGLKGYRVGWAGDGREALNYLRRGDWPDLILLDLALPEMDGWQFRREQCHDPALAAIPVVLVSADEDLPRSAAALGARGYLEKPVGLDDLVRAVRQHC